MKGAVLQTSACQFCEEPSMAISHEDDVGRSGTSIVDVVRARRGPSAVMGRVVVENDVDGFNLRQLSLNRVEETDELLMRVTLHVTADHRAVENIEGGKQGGGAMALVDMGHRAAPGLLQRMSWLRLVASA